MITGYVMMNPLKKKSGTSETILSEVDLFHTKVIGPSCLIAQNWIWRLGEPPLPECVTIFVQVAATDLSRHSAAASLA